MPAIPIDVERLNEFELHLDPQHPETSEIPARVLGYGEISTVFAIQAPGLDGLAFKRLPLFNDQAEVEAYRTVYDGYNRLLEQDAGIHLPRHGSVDFPGPNGRPVFYIIQEQLSSDSICSRAIQLLPREAVCVLVTRVMQELYKIWDLNRKQQRMQVGFDGQLSNWAIADFDPARPRVENAILLYLDTSTPLFRLGGVEQLNPELFLRSAPSFLVWILRVLFLKDVINRYYDFHLVATDLVANLYKEGKRELVPDVVRAVNDFLAGPGADLGVAPVSEKEAESYYREDAFIWSLFLSMRKFDRWLRMRVLRRPYPYILPGKISR